MDPPVALVLGISIGILLGIMWDFSGIGWNFTGGIDRDFMRFEGIYRDVVEISWEIMSVFYSDLGLSRKSWGPSVTTAVSTIIHGHP